MAGRQGFAGRTAGAFLSSKLTPVIVVVSLLLGLGAVWLTPKEEEPQISVPMIDVRVPAPGFLPEEVERQVAEPIERALWGLEGVEYIYSTSQDHAALITVRFKVGEPMEPSLVKVHHKLMAMRNELPPKVRAPVVQALSIDDVPFLVLSFTSPTLDDFELRTRIAPLARELAATPNLSRVELLGGRKRAVRVIADPNRLAAHGISLPQLAEALRSGDALSEAGKNWAPDLSVRVEVGARLKSAEEIRNLPVGQRGGALVLLKQVARVEDGPEQKVRGSVLMGSSRAPARSVSIAFSKRPGTNVVELSAGLLEVATQYLKNNSPGDIDLVVMRDYGSTAAGKARELIEHLLLATLSVAILIALFMGIRAALVVAISIPVTLALTLAIYYFAGYTLNRVTLFALIFSIGILVDDAIVVVENIERHLRLRGGRGFLGAVREAVEEVGNPTILATFTVIAAILPMAFVRGLMGPYMKPIPVGASLAMIFSLWVAFAITPWASALLLKAHSGGDRDSEPGVSRLDAAYRSLMGLLLRRRRAAWGFVALVLVLFAGAAALVPLKLLKVKMLPFDNKNEFQVLLDFPVGTTLQSSEERATLLAQELARSPEVKAVQVYTGEAAPFSFSGMVKHSFLRNGDHQADLQVLLTDYRSRKRSSHAVIEQLRPAIRAFSETHSALSKVLEIPPGPPVLATMVAEIYAPDRKAIDRAAASVQRSFSEEPSVVDLDSTLRPDSLRRSYAFQPGTGGLLGTQASMAQQLGALVFSETALTTLQAASAPEEVAVTVSLDGKARAGREPFAGLKLPSASSGSVEAAKVLDPPRDREARSLHRKNLRPVAYVTSELSGPEEAPVYGVLKLAPRIPFPLFTSEVPWNLSAPAVKWDGEWFITYEVFRDLGAAFAVVMLLIYVLVLGWFRSFTIPLVIMAPIPVSLIGILPGHALLGSYFTATSMIGFIAGAGIIVRNSIILVDFIEQQLQAGMPLREAVISAGVLRFRPMLLTAAAVVVGSAVMLADPIFQGLAASLIFGELAATILSRFAVPVMYYWLVGGARARELEAAGRPSKGEVA